MSFSSFGIALKRGNGGTPETFEAVAEVKDIKPFKLKAETKETTHHGSAGGWRTFKATLIEGGECTFKINFLPDDTTHSFAAGLAADLMNRQQRNYQIILPDTTTTGYQFAAIVTQFDPDGPVDGLLETDVTLKITGAVTEV
jgi:predicted secreted protein